MLRTESLEGAHTHELGGTGQKTPAVFVIVVLSVCLSVSPSVTLVDCVHMVRPTITISSPYGSPIILVSGDITFIPKFEGGHSERGH